MASGKAALQLLHAVDMLVAHDWEQAKLALETLDDPIAGRLHLLVGECERREREEKRHAAFLRHEIGNALSIAMATVEGMVDGVLPFETERLHVVDGALHDVAAMLERWRKGVTETELPSGCDETFNICALIGAQYAGITGLAQAKGVRVAYYPCGKAHDACRNFHGDPVAVAQILRNVLINAVRYTPPGGNVELACELPEGELVVTIRDSGPGIAPADAAHIFEEGYRASETPGEGLGLAVVDNLLRSFGGRARVVETSAAGTTFLIALPAVPA